MKDLVRNYVFDASAQTITFTDYNPVVLESVLLITNVTSNVIIYNFAAPGKGGSVATNVLTLGFDTTAMSDTDDLAIWYQDGTIPASDTSLTDIKTKLDTLIAATDTLEGNTDGVEGLLTSIRDYVDTVETKLQAIADNTDGLEGFTDGIETLLTAIRDYVDTVEGLLSDVSTATNQGLEITQLTAIAGSVDTLETKLQSLIDQIGEVQASPTTNTVQDRLKGLQTTLTAINSNTDQLEGFVDGLEALETAIGDNTDTLEAKLQAIADNTDNLPTSLGQQTMAASLPVVLPSNQSLTITGPITTTPAYQTLTDTITAAADSVTAVVQQYTQVLVQISGTYSGATIFFEQSFDGGTFWFTCPLTTLNNTPSQAIGSVTPGANATAAYQGTVGAATNFRVRASAFSAGTMTVVLSNTTDPLIYNTNASIVNTPSVNMSQYGGTTVVNAGVAGSQAVGGNVATNVAIGTNPINQGGQAVSSENAAVTAGRMVQQVFDLVGKQIVLPYANPENIVSGAITSAMTATTSTSLVAAPASGLRNYITQITVSNSHATVGTDIIIQDGSGGTTLYVIPAASVYGGASVTFPVALRQPTTATALYCANVTTGSSTKVSASGYKGA